MITSLKCALVLSYLILLLRSDKLTRLVGFLMQMYILEEVEPSWKIYVLLIIQTYIFSNCLKIFPECTKIHSLFLPKCICIFFFLIILRM